MANMKKTTSISILALCASLMLSCSLDKMPVDRLTAEAVFEDSESFLLWMNECYTMFEGQKVILTDADDFIDADPCEAVCGERSPYTESWDWSMLHHINYLLEHVKECTDADIAREATAEARFFRGMFYFEMARKYGALPYITNTIGMQNKELMYANPIPQDYVIDAALIDLQDAADSLSADLSPIPAKINRWVALGYMARAALYEGTLLKYQGEAKEDYEEYLQQAADACREIIASGKFSLCSEPSDFFKTAKTDESIFEFIFSSSDKLPSYTYYLPAEKGGRLDYIPTPDLSRELLDPARGGKRAQLIEAKGDGVYVIAQYAKQDGSSSIQSLRLAEQYLIRAEALLKQSSPDISWNYHKSADTWFFSDSLFRAFPQKMFPIFFP